MKTTRLETTVSTNRVAMELGHQGAAHGDAVIAQHQTGGKGRLGRSWQSPPGKGLYCSVILRPGLLLQDFPRLTFSAGLAVAGAVSELYGVAPGLKWPNDIYFGVRKCGGILCESSGTTTESQQPFAIVGIGLNVLTTMEDLAEDLHHKATSLLLETGREIPIEQIFSAIHKKLLAEVSLFVHEGFQQVIARWRRYDCMKGRRMAWVTVRGERVEGISLGPDDGGVLYIKDDTGKLHQVLSGDVELAELL